MSSRCESTEPLLAQAGWLRRFARALVHDDDLADDVAQSALVTAWQRPPAEPDRNPRGWLARVATHRTRDLSRAERRRADSHLAAAEHADQLAASPEQLMVDLELHRTVASIIADLPVPYRDVIVRRYFDGQTAAEIARELAVPPGTVRWRLKEALERVRKALDARFGERTRWQPALAALVPSRTSRKPATPPALPAASLVVAGAALVVGLGGITSLAWQHGAAPEQPRASAALPGSHDVPAVLPRFAADEHSRGSDLGRSSDFDADRLARRLLDAVAVGSYDDFADHAGDRLTAGVTKAAFDASSVDVGARLRRGYVLDRLGSLRQQRGILHLWRLTPSDDGDDYLVRMSVDGGAVVAFLIQ